MDKAERLVQELTYLNKYPYFNLKNLMTEFSISKRTALRDLSALKEMGLAIYSERGKYGGYRIISRDPLIPVTFTSNEIAAILFAIHALHLLSDNPFQQSYPRITQRLLTTLGNSQLQSVEKLQEVVEYYQVPPIYHNFDLHRLLEAIINFKTVKLKTSQFGGQERCAQLRHLLYLNGNWFVEGIDIQKKEPFRYRCDLLTVFEEQSTHAPFTFSEIDQLANEYRQKIKAKSFECLITSAGKERFTKNNYPGMKVGW